MNVTENNPFFVDTESKIGGPANIKGSFYLQSVISGLAIDKQPCQKGPLIENL